MSPLEDRRVEPRAEIALIVVALLARLVLALRLPADQIPWSDGREYAEIARSLLHHGGYGLQTLRPPGYPTFMAAVWALLGESLPRLRAVECVIGTLAVWWIGRCGAAWFGGRAGLLAMALAAFHPVLAFLPGTQYSENLLVLVMVFAWGAWLTALLDRRTGLARWALGGALMGLAALIRPNVLLLLPGFAIAAAFQLTRARREWVRPALIAVAAFVLVLTPWTLRNHHVHGRWYFVASGGGRALWLGNNERTTGRAGSIMLPDSAFAARLAREPDELAMDRGFRDEAVAWMRAHPQRAFELYFVRFGSLFALYPETYTRTPFLEHGARIAQGALTLLVYAGALFGFVALRGSPIRAPILGAIVGFALVHAMFFSVLRYRMPFEPVLLWLAGVGGAALWPRARPVER